MSRRSRRVTVPVLTAMAPVLAAALSLASVAEADVIFTDPPGDATYSAPDITSVVVSDDPARGTIRFRVNVEGGILLVWIDADRDKSTGIQMNPLTGSSTFLRGTDYVLDYGNQSPGTATLSTWDGVTFALGPSSAQAVVSGGTTTLSISKSDIGNTSSFDFKVRSLGDLGLGADDAPEFQAGWWTYTLTILNRLTVEKRGPGSGTVVDSTGALDCGATCSADFEQGQTVTLLATPDDDSTFAGWSGGGCSGTGSTCILTLSEDTVVTASFAKKPPPGTPSGSATGIVLVGGAPYSSGPIPYGSRVDVTNGTLKLTTRVGTLELSGRGVSAIFQLLKRSERGQALDLLRLVGGDFSVCTKSRRTISSAVQEKKKKKTVRRLWARGKGRFRTQGRHSYTTVRGTDWLTADRCDGTLTQVRQGRVEVFDLVRRTRVLVRAGESYVATK